MKATGVILAAAALQGVAADFWVHYVSRIDVMPYASPTQAGVAFTHNPDITCDSARGPTVWPNVGDASGRHPGVRCDPGDDVGFPLYRDPLNVVEFNTPGELPGHHTIYKARGYAMVDLEDKKSGQCYLNRTFVHDLDCPNDEGRVILSGSSMFFCSSDISI
ncbi:hypothetical protein GGR53DRAFT_19242 [Hypoxylon sp. FL1150]|nr:hypothetical protein GGR53DRAFT_19242 [Hypoxylon sp. FL1150]